MDNIITQKNSKSKFRGLIHSLFILGALFLFNSSYGQIFYSGELNTNIITPIDTNNNFSLDFDGLSGDDINFFISSTEVAPGFVINTLNVQGLNGAEVVATAGPDALLAATPINSLSTWSNVSQLMNSHIFGVVSGNWPDSTSAYLGFRFTNAESTHYGWMQIAVTTALDFMIVDYAYEMTPDIAIVAGSMTSLGVEQEFSSHVNAYAFNQEVNIKNLPEDATYSLYSMFGQEVKTGRATRSFYKFETSSLTKGIYVLKIRGDKSGKELTKKLIL